MPAPQPDEHARAVSSMFGRIARWYDFLNHALSLGQDIYWRYRLARLARPGPTGTALDLAAGTMDVSLELLRQHPSLRVLAADFSRPMLERGLRKVPDRLRHRVAPVLADGRRLPVADASVDCVTIAFGIRNILPRQEAYAEILRVLAPGGRLCVLEFGSGRQRIWLGLYNLYLNRLLPALGRLVSGDGKAYRYLSDTIGGFPTAPELADELRDAGFAQAFYVPLLSGIVNIHVARKG